MRSRRIGVGLSLGMFVGLLGMSLWQCSFYLPERSVCTDKDKCTQMPDMPPPPPDMKDPSDPSMSGSFGAATLTVVSPAGIGSQILMGPSDDGTTLSARQATYPLVLMAPPKNVPIDPMKPYANRLVSHGFIVGLWYSTDQTYDPNYRDAGLAYLDAIINGSTPSVKDHIDTNKIGLIGYELSAKIALGMAVYKTAPPLIASVFLIDPTDLFSPSPRIDGPSAASLLHLPNNTSLVMLGEPKSVMDPNPCIAKPQKSYADIFAAANSPALAIVFQGANLADFMTGYPDTACAVGSTTPPATTQALAIKYATAYMQWTLKGSSKARDYLMGPEFNTDAQTANLTPMTK